MKNLKLTTNNMLALYIKKDILIIEENPKIISHQKMAKKFLNLVAKRN